MYKEVECSHLLCSVDIAPVVFLYDSGSLVPMTNILCGGEYGHACIKVKLST